MKTITLNMKCALSLAVAGILAAGPVLADKPAGAGKGGKNEHSDQRNEQKGEKRDEAGHAGGQRSNFEDQHRVMVREYYAEQTRSGRCPPGLAKKHNGCMPPGQAKKWNLGQPLPRDVIFYNVPQPLALQIGPPPSGYRYVRVATDILMIAIGTGMIVDAIQDLGR